MDKSGALAKVRFDDMIDTVLAQPLNGGAVRVTVYRQLIDLIAQGRADHDEGLARRAYAAIDSLRDDVPREVRASMANALAGLPVPALLVVHFSQEQVRDVAHFLSAAQLAEEEWLGILSAIPPQARSLLRSRRDLPEHVMAALEFFGPSDLALAPPEEPELPWVEIYGERLEADTLSAPLVQRAAVHENIAEEGGVSGEAEMPEAVPPFDASVTEHPAELPSFEMPSFFASTSYQAHRRRVDNLFETAAPVPEPVVEPKEENADENGRDPSLIDGETQIRELLRRIEEFRARIPRKQATVEDAPESLSVNTDDADDAYGTYEAVQAAEPPAEAIPAEALAPIEAKAEAIVAPIADPPQPLSLGQDFRWETDVAGTIVWVEGIAREAVIGRSVALSEPEAIEGVDMRVATAFARRAPFRDGRLRLPGSGEASGLWLISGVPFFDPRGGKFGGFRGTARRFQEIPATADRQEAPQAARHGHTHAVLIERRASPRQPASPEAVRQMVHELRTPLNAIVGFAEMIDQQMLGPAAEGYRDRARDILGDAHRLIAAIDDMDAAARSVGGAVDGPPLVDAGNLVERIIARYRGLSRERGIELIGSIAIGLPAIETSGEVLERVVSRLFAAVIGAARAGDRLTYGVGSGERDSVRIFLSRPAGLAGRDAQTLYDPASAGFSSGLEAPALGLGFGLRLVRQLASALGGQFEIEDALFMLTLPCNRAKPNAAGNVA